MKKALAIVLVLLAVFSAFGQKIDRPVTIVCAFSAGGGTDLINRALAEGMKEALGVQVNVQNMTGAGGGIAMDYVWQKERDGLTILGISETGFFIPVNAAHTTTAKDWQWFWAGGSPGLAMVPAKSKYKTWGDLVKDAKANPDKVKVAASVYPGLWSIKWLSVANAMGIKTKILPYAGSAPALTAVLTGEVDVLHVSAGEALAYLQTGALRPLIATEIETVEIPKVGKVDAITKAYPELKKVLPMPQLLGLAIPLDTPAAIKDQITAAFNAAMKSEPVTRMLAQQLAATFGYSGEKANEVSRGLEAKFSWTMQDLGLAKVNPETLGIKKP